jgi:hypothetical protein
MSEQPITVREPLPWWWKVMLLVIIIWAAAFTVFPSVRAIQPLNFATNSLFVVWVILYAIRETRRGLLGKTVPEIHALAKRGVQLRMDPLESSAAVAFAVTTIVRAFW